jgi:hypothetical protein
VQWRINFQEPAAYRTHSFKLMLKSVVNSCNHSIVNGFGLIRTKSPKIYTDLKNKYTSIRQKPSPISISISDLCYENCCGDSISRKKKKDLIFDEK